MTELDVSRRLHVLFVCRYNRGRSPMAATIFAEQLRRRGLGGAVRVSSAGTASVLAGSGIDPRAGEVLLRRGYCVPEQHRATQVGDGHLDADLVVALGLEHVGLLQRRGVVDDRIRYVDVANPVSANDFETAFHRIDAAMPALHGWVNQRIVPTRLETAVGWRFWTVPPATADVLCAPYKALGEPWPSTKHRAVCISNRQHEPPHPGCECGIYVDLDAHSACRRALFAVGVPSFGTRDRRSALVVGRVALEGAVTYVPPLSGMPELRAAAAEVLELYVLPVRHQPDAHLLVDPLTARYRVPVCYGVPVDNADGIVAAPIGAVRD